MAAAKLRPDRLSAMLAIAESEANRLMVSASRLFNAVERLLKKSGLRLRDLAVPGPPAEHKAPLMGTWRETCRRLHGTERMTCGHGSGALLPILPKFHAPVEQTKRWILNEIAVQLGMQAMSADSITVLRCARGLRLAKLIRPGEIVTYDSTRTYDAWTVQIGGLADLETLLADMIEQPRLCVVRGKLAGGDKVFGIRRLLYPDKETGDAATLLDIPRQWVALDIEGVQRPQGVPVADLAACARVAVQRLPAAFNSAACIVQATAGHGIKPDLRLRLWYWLTSADGWRRVEALAEDARRRTRVSFARHRSSTPPHPFLRGWPDHLPARLLGLPGLPSVAVPSVAALALQYQPPSPCHRFLISAHREQAHTPVPCSTMPHAALRQRALTSDTLPASRNRAAWRA